MDRSGSQTTEGAPTTSNLMDTGLSTDTDDGGSIQNRLDQKKQDENLSPLQVVSQQGGCGGTPHIQRKVEPKLHRRQLLTHAGT